MHRSLQPDIAPARRLRHPERLLVLLAAAVLALLTAASIVIFAATDELGWGSPRWSYFLYLAGLVALGAILVRRPRFATIALGLATVDLCLGIGSLWLSKAELAYSALLPSRYDDPPRFQWHPLLQAVPIPSIQRKVVHLRVGHSREGTRGRNYAQEELAGRIVIATFGGSTTYGISVSDDETWASRLETKLGSDRFAVINHGVPGYTTVEHLIQTAFYQARFGAEPRCALYYVGWNDLRNAHLRGLDPGYADFHLPSQVDGLQVRRIGSTTAFASPTLTLLTRVASVWIDTVRQPIEPVGDGRAGPDPVFEDVFLRNVRAISAINRSRGITTLWIGQILNEAHYTDDAIDGWLPLLRNKDVLPQLRHLLDRLRVAAEVLRDVYIDVPAAAFKPADFRDNGHFLPSGSRLFARLIAPAVERACR